MSQNKDLSAVLRGDEMRSCFLGFREDPELGMLQDVFFLCDRVAGMRRVKDLVEPSDERIVRTQRSAHDAS